MAARLPLVLLVHVLVEEAVPLVPLVHVLVEEAAAEEHGDVRAK